MERERSVAAVTLSFALAAVPASIAIAETLLAVALVARIANLTKKREAFLPHIFWYWLAWAAVEIVSWIQSPHPKLGWGEIRHLLLIAALFVVLPVLPRLRQRVNVWCGIFVTSTLSSLVLISIFFMRLHHYLNRPPGSLYASEYLRTGGLLHNWMVYATVEIIVFAGLLEFRYFYPKARNWTLPALVIQSCAIVVSLTRMLWVCALVLLLLHLIWRRSRWALAIPVLPALIYLAAPGVVRSRVAESLDKDYYSNAERLQMIQVGWQMLREHPFYGVGPGRVDHLYVSYLPPGAPVPAYHGHLHDNLIQLAAEFGWPTAVAAAILVVILSCSLWKRYRQAVSREEQFLARSALLALIGFLIAGTMDYTYGHSLGLILLGFAVISPLLPRPRRRQPSIQVWKSTQVFRLGPHSHVRL